MVKRREERVWWGKMVIEEDKLINFSINLQVLSPLARE